MAKEITLQLPEETAARLEASARKSGRSISETGARSIEEWLRQDEFPEIEFRTFNGERHACLRGVTQLWQLIMVAEQYDLDVEKTATYFQLPPHRIQAAIDYYRAFPDEIDRPIAENRSWTYERLKQVLPQLVRVSVQLDPDDNDELP
jgi:hypothetical protein